MSTLRILSGLVAALVAGSALALPATEPAAGPSLRLEDAVSAALERNPMLAGARAGSAAAQARLTEARAAWLPRVDASGTLMRSDNPVFVFGSLLEQGRFGAQHFDPSFLNDPDAMSNFRLGVNVRYPLFDQFRRFNAVKSAKNGVDAAGYATEEARQRLRVEAVSRFYGLLLAEEKQKVAAEAVTSAEADAESMRARSEQGLLVESDLLAAEVQLASFRQRLIEAEGDVAIARAALATLVQRPVTEPLAAEGAIPERELPAIDLETAIGNALAARGEVKSAASDAGTATLQLQTARGSLLPRVDTFASWGASGTSLSGGDPDRAVGVVVGFDLFDGAKPARIAASRAGVDAARAMETTARDRVRMEVVSAWYHVRAAKDRIEVARRSAERADAAARIVRDRHQNGLTTITEHLRAQTALVTARLELLAARYDYLVGYAELMRSTGGLNDVEAFH